ncbi:hypothetical protein [Candidatus Lokiarchaeum ossiferum]|uniref:hypothetical protein n=1 Tax=Candidatus Lokiarchaeum ossiferum TaxID=2951803 RepID=UPI00352C041D
MAFDPVYYTFMEYFTLVLTIIFLFYTVIPFVKYIQRRKIMALYFSLSNLTYVITLVVTYIGIVTSLDLGDRSPSFMASMFVMNISMILGAFCLYLFCSKLASINKKKVYAVGTIGSIFMVFSIVIFNNWMDSDTTGFQIKYISLLFLTIYSIGVYSSIIRIFGKDLKNLTEMRSQYHSIVYGSITSMLFFIGMLVRSAARIDSIVYNAIIWVILVIGVGFYFIGFIQPSLKKKVKESKDINLETKNLEIVN